MRVLLVEDQIELRQIFRRMVEVGLGCTVREAADGVDGLAALVEPWDLIITDLGMPRMDGFCFMDAVRHHHRHKLVPIVALSGDAHSTTEHRARACGATVFLSKPVRLEDLLGVVMELLNPRKKVGMG